MKDTYFFPAIFNCTQEGISVTFPDLPGCVTCANDYAEAVQMAHDCLSGWLYISERDNEAIPEPSDPLKLKGNLKDTQIVVPVEVFMPVVRSKFEDKAVNKTVTIPNWLLDEGKNAGINFSQTLQDALMQKLGIHREIKRRKYKNKTKSKQYA